MNLKDLPIETLEAMTGTLSNPGKMPCFSTSISASTCRTGQKLAKIKGSVCSGCYAMKGNYRFSNVQEAMEKRIKNIEHPMWPYYMAELIKRKEKSNYFRIHDSGDIRSIRHLANICKMAELLPDVKMWLPSREHKIISDYCKNNKIPKNLTIRLSAYMVDGKLPTALARKLGVKTSGVTTDKKKANCNSWKQGGKCLDCRKCWDKRISNVNYLKH